MDCSGLREDLLDVLYDEAGPDAARRVEGHLAACPPCRDELQTLRRLRRDLAAWKSPEARPFAAAARRTRFLAAAAALLLATGAAFALSRSEVLYENGQLSFRI